MLFIVAREYRIIRSYVRDIRIERWFLHHTHLERQQGYATVRSHIQTSASFAAIFLQIAFGGSATKSAWLTHCRKMKHVGTTNRNDRSLERSLRFGIPTIDRRWISSRSWPFIRASLTPDRQMTQEELAERAGLSARYVGAIERGDVSASVIRARTNCCKHWGPNRENCSRGRRGLANPKPPQTSREAPRRMSGARGIRLELTRRSCAAATRAGCSLRHPRRRTGSRRSAR